MSDSDDSSRSAVEEIEGSDYTEESYYEEEVVEVSARDDDDDSCLETLPPPISIPDVFRTHELEDEDAKRRSFEASFDDETGRVCDWKPTSSPTSSAGNVIKNAVHVSDSESDSSDSGDDHNERLKSPPPVIQQQKEIEDAAYCESESYSDEEEEEEQESVPPPVVEEDQPAPPKPIVNSKFSSQAIVKEEPELRLVARPEPAPAAVTKEAPPSPVKKEENSTIRQPMIITNTEIEPENTNDPCAWKKPDWTKKKVLRSTDNGEKFKKEGTLSVPITKISEVIQEKKNLGFEKPDWTKKKVLKSSSKGEKLKKGETISRPIGGIKAIDS